MLEFVVNLILPKINIKIPVFDSLFFMDDCTNQTCLTSSPIEEVKIKIIIQPYQNKMTLMSVIRSG